MSEGLSSEAKTGVAPARDTASEKSAFVERLMKVYCGELVAYAKQLLGKNVTLRSAEDIVQVAFVKMLEQEKQGQLDRIVNPRAWLHTVVRNEIFGDHRKEGRRPRAAEGELEDIPGEHDPSLDLHREQMRKKLQAAIQTLSPEHAEIVTLFLADCPHLEAARQLGIKYNTYKTRLRRALGQLKEFLNAAGIGLTEV